MVIYSKYAGNEVKLEDEEYIIVKQSDILAIVE
jgi:chaperonin GroES